MAYEHGITVSEVATSLVPAVNTEAGLPVVVGTAPVHLATDPAKVNKPILCYTYAEAVQKIGFSSDWENYSLNEVIYAAFSLFNCAPIVFINVLDPAKHKESIVDVQISVNEKLAKINEPVILSSLKVKAASAGQALTEGTDYEAIYDDDGVLNITILPEGQLAEASEIYVDYDKLDPAAVTADDIIGGIDASTGSKEGLEAINDVYPLYGLVPGTIAAPGWSHNPEVASVMKAKTMSINGLFTAICLTDVPTDTATKYSDVPNWKNQNNYTDVNQVVCWPKVRNGNDIFYMSTQLIGVLANTDAANGNIPYKSPSNENMQATGLCLEDGSEVIIGLEEANYLNGQGIVTGLNFIGGWKLWGNRTGCYPANTDPKDSFIALRRMFNWHRQTFILTFWQKVDDPMIRRNIDAIVDSENIRLNGLVSAGVLLGGRIEFREEDNPTTSLIDGRIKFHTYYTPPVPMREIQNELEFDTNAFENLFN